MEKIQNVELYSSIAEMPMFRKHLFDKFLILDMGLGADLNAIEAKHQNLNIYARNKKWPETIQELKNLHHTMFNAISEIDFKHLAFACMVAQIDDKPVTCKTEDDADKILDAIGDIINDGEAVEYVVELKKKLLMNLGYTFQAVTPTPKT